MTSAEYKNVEDRLLEVKKHILEEPKRLDMSFWLLSSDELIEICHVDKEEQPTCGIVGCIAGWLVSLDALKHGSILSQVGIQNKARELLNHPPSLARLFFHLNWREDLVYRFKDSISKQERAIITGEAIDWYLNLIKKEVQVDEQTPNQ